MKIFHYITISQFFKLNYLLLIFYSFKCFGQYQSCTNTSICHIVEPYPTVSFAIEKAFETADYTINYQSPIIIDIDNDCVPEIIMAGTTGAMTNPRLTSGITIVCSQTGTTIFNFPTAMYAWCSGNSYAVADVDGDGYPEIVIAAANHFSNNFNLRGRLICYNFDGSVKWISDQNYGNNVTYAYGGTVGFADFNKDGIPEVYIYNEIFNAQTGIKLADGGLNGTGLHYEHLSYDGSVSVSIAAQLDSDTSGLELAAGYTIYKVNINNPNGMIGNSMTPYNITIDGSLRDGFTSIADINQDGQLDVIVSTYGNNSNAKLYAYSLNNNITQLLAKTDLPSGSTSYHWSGHPLIGDIDGSGLPTITLTRPYRLLAYRYNGSTSLQQYWSLTTNDMSGMTGMTMFDFNQDGAQEIVYRDETQLRIINGGIIPPVVLASFNCISGTGLEKPVVADIDNTGSSKICVTCGAHLTSKIEVFAAPMSQQKWAPSRGVWNQYAYHVLNIDENLTIPQFPENNATFANGRYNNFLVQSSLLDTNGNYIQAAADLMMDIHCLNYNPITDEYTVEFSVYNNSSASENATAGFPIAFFNGNPETTGTLLGVYHTTAILNIGQSFNNIFYTFGAAGITNFNILYGVANTDGTNTGIPFQPSFFNVPECDYINNFHVFNIAHNATCLFDTICEGNSYYFNNQTIMDTGTYYMFITNTIGCDSVIALHLSFYQFYPDLTDSVFMFCEGDTIFLCATGGNNYLWTGPNGFTSNDSTTFISNATSVNGGIYNVNICNQYCCFDTTVNVIITPTPNTTATSNLPCVGQYIQLFASGGNTYYWVGPNNFSSNIQNPIITNVLISDSGLYNVTVYNYHCFDTASVYVTVYPTPNTDAGQNETITIGDNIMLNGSGVGAYNWYPPDNINDPSSQNPLAYPLVTTNYILTVTNQYGCTATDNVLITVLMGDIYIPNCFSPNNDGLNDIFHIYSTSIAEIELYIFNRWGEIIFRTNNMILGWDGTYKGFHVPDGVYTYYLEAVLLNNEVLKKIGHITIFR